MLEITKPADHRLENLETASLALYYSQKMNNKIIPKLKYGSTWKLFGLCAITYGVYGAHYIKTKTSLINEECEVNGRISDSFVNFIIVINYVSLALFIPYFFVEETSPIALLGDLVDLVCNVTFIVWGFMARNRMNVILSASESDGQWFHGFGTFFFSPYYFNFKVNKLSESIRLDCTEGEINN